MPFDVLGIGGAAGGVSLGWTEKQSFSAHRRAEPREIEEGEQ